MTVIEKKIRVKVSSVKGIRDPEGGEGIKIDFVEIRKRAPIVMMTPKDVPEDVGKMVTQISKGIQLAIPGGSKKEYELQKITLHLTTEELEAFQLKPYPNQRYEITISQGNISFKMI